MDPTMERVNRLVAGLGIKAVPVWMVYHGDRPAPHWADYLGSAFGASLTDEAAMEIITAHGLCYLASQEDDDDPSDHFSLRALKDGRWGVMRLSEDGDLLEWLAVDKPTPVEAVLAAIRNLEGLVEVGP